MEEPGRSQSTGVTESNVTEQQSHALQRLCIIREPNLLLLALLNHDTAMSQGPQDLEPTTVLRGRDSLGPLESSRPCPRNNSPRREMGKSPTPAEGKTHRWFRKAPRLASTQHLCLCGRNSCQKGQLEPSEHTHRVNRLLGRIALLLENTGDGGIAQILPTPPRGQAF